jgi:hypothetical protein
MRLPSGRFAAGFYDPASPRRRRRTSSARRERFPGQRWWRPATSPDCHSRSRVVSPPPIHWPSAWRTNRTRPTRRRGPDECRRGSQGCRCGPATEPASRSRSAPVAPHSRSELDPVTLGSGAHPIRSCTVVADPLFWIKTNTLPLPAATAAQAARRAGNPRHAWWWPPRQRVVPGPAPRSTHRSRGRAGLTFSPPVVLMAPTRAVADRWAA